MSDVAATRRWLLSRLDRHCIDTLTQLLSTAADHLGTATGDAVALWTLSPDRSSLTPVAVFHPDPDQAAATAAVVHEAAQPTGTGLWRPIVESRQPRRWHITPGVVPDEASAPQREVLRQLPIRAILGVPLLAGGRLIGGISLVRYVAEQEYTREDETLVRDAARRIALVLVLRERISTSSFLTDRGTLAFDHAVAQERRAIALHDQAAWRHERIAAELEQHALHDRDSNAEHALEVAATARDRAEQARSRADRARRRLRVEGVDPSR